MTQPLVRENPISTPPMTAHEPKRYLVLRRRDEWMIEFGGEEFGPYKTEREALLFAVDAANKLGRQDQFTEVLLQEENGQTRAVWRYGRESYPPAF